MARRCVCERGHPSARHARARAALSHTTVVSVRVPDSLMLQPGPRSFCSCQLAGSAPTLTALYCLLMHEV